VCIYCAWPGHPGASDLPARRTPRTESETGQSGWLPLSDSLALRIA